MNSEFKIFEIFVDDIIPNRFQPRLSFDDDKINELSESIKAHGIIQPLVLRQIGEKYEIIAGERRFKAASLAGLTKVPAIISNLDDNQSAEVALVENIQRRNLSSIEEAKSFKKLLDRGYINQDQLAVKMGMSQSSIANKLRLLNLDEEVQKALLEEKISERHARSLLALEDYNQQKEMLNRIKSERLTVRQLDEAVKKMKKDNETTNNFESDSVEKFEIPASFVETIPVENIFQQTEEPIIADSFSQPQEIVEEPKPEEKPKDSFVDLGAITGKSSNIYFNTPPTQNQETGVEFLDIPTLEEMSIINIAPTPTFTEDPKPEESINNPVSETIQNDFVPFDDTKEEPKVEEFILAEEPKEPESLASPVEGETKLSIKIDKSNFRTVEKVFEELKQKVIEAGLNIDMDTYNFEEYYQLIIKIYK